MDPFDFGPHEAEAAAKITLLSNKQILHRQKK